MKTTNWMGALVMSAALLGGCAGEIALAPPPARVEVAPPAPYAGAVWIDGYWDWSGGRHVWRAGHYERPRPGYIWVGRRWERRGHGWRASGGRWHRL
jgi:hypothetical protein